jgi:hypothetical protein
MAASLPAATYSHTYSHSEDAHEKRDLDALLSFRKAITSDPLEMLFNWTAENSHNICSWYGIRCTQYTRRVVAIDLSPSTTGVAFDSGGHRNVEYRAGLKGTLSSSLSILSLLHRLDLSGNFLMGTIPLQFGHLKALRVLDLSYNAINVSIPIELVLLQKLRTLDLSSNSLMGRIPPEFGQLKALRLLHLRWNKLSGSIPAELGLLQKLENLTLQDNYFSGNIPCQLGNLTHLTQLSISSINIFGSIPSQIFKLPLSILSLSFNFTGSVPKANDNVDLPSPL